MPKYLLFTTLFLSVVMTGFSQSKDNYNTLWEEVQKFENQGLPKSALEVTERIYRKAEKEKNAGQLVKAVMHKFKFAGRIEENALVKNIAEMEKEIGKSEYPVTPLLHSMLAEMYWGYYSQNRWKFYNRSETIDFKNDDIETWSLEHIVAKVTKEYLASLEKPEKLQAVKIDLYDEVLVPFYSDLEKKKSRKLRPTLYDFLAHRAVDFFMNDQGQLNRPVYEFNLNSEAYLSPAHEFKNVKIETRDSTSLKFYALTVLQDLIRFHLKDSDPSALIDAELKRLNFVYANAVFAGKEEAMLETVEKEESFYKNHPAGTEFTYEKASLIYARSQKYRPLVSNQFKHDAKRAADICREGMKRFPESDGAVNCRSLLSQIEAKSFSLQAEEVNTIGNPFRILVNFKNVSKIYLRALKTSPEEIERLTKQYNTEKYKYDYQKEIIRYFVGKKAAQTWEAALPNDGDLQQHGVETKAPGLEPGYYILLAGSDPNLSTDNNAVAYAFTTVSDISYIFRKTEKEQYEFHLLHRDKGHALKGVKARLWYQVYDDSERGYKKVDGGTFVSDEEGKITVPAPKFAKRESFSLDFSLKNDFLSTDARFYHFPYKASDNNTNAKRQITYFFTDRTIYRPGQTIYFKGIMLETDGEKAEIKPKENTTVTFYDVNHQKVADLHLTTNEYGSFSGSFTAPMGILNGQMYLSDYNGSIYFSVEEYKRPKFETVFLPVEGNYKLNEKITVKGNAKAYAGNNIDGAQVRYRVVRNVVLPHWCYYFWYHPPYGSNTEIINGTTVTNEKGEFNVEFNAVPDPETDPQFQPVFNYTVYADVTDLNGETRSTQTTVSAGYRALNITLGIPDELEKDSLTSDNFTIHTANLNGTFQPASGSLVIHRLKTPEKAFRNRLWARPDTFVMSREEFYKNFPYDLYKDEDNKYTWEKEKKVFETSFNTAKEKKFNLKNMRNVEQGVYVAEVISKDIYGTEVKELKYFTVYAPREKTLPYPQPSRMLSVKVSGEPGEKALFTIGSGFEDVHMLYEVDRKDAPLQEQWLSITKAQRLLEIPIEEQDRGGFVAQFTFVKHNRFYHQRENVWVPRTDKQLDVTLETFRDKLLPGSEETWKVKIKGKKGDKAAAELLVSMYDASLDAFRSGPSWYLNPYADYYGKASWESQTFARTVYSTMYDRGGWNTYYSGTSVTYDQLNNFGTYYLWGYGHYGKYRGAFFLGRDEEYDDGYVLRGRAADKVTAEVQAAPVASKKSERNKEAPAEDKAKQPANFKNDAAAPPPPVTGENPQGGTPVRRNFNETAFFFPHLTTDEDGHVVFSFKMPDALTRWRFNALAHTKDVKSGGAMQTVITQKDLMVVPNAPRFFREGDELVFTAKISNLAQKSLKGTARIEFFDALTMKPINGLIIAKNPRGTSAENILSAPFSVEKEQSTQVAWSIYIPEGIQAVTYRIRAAAGNFTDGEEMTLPVLTNRMLVTESLPLPMRGTQTKTFEFTKLIGGNSGSNTLRSHKLTLEFTSNPAWYAIQALPYLMEYPYECSEQTFSRLYANSIASHIANSSPKIKNIFEAWKNKQSGSEAALLSNLEKNQELKSALLEETPWVLQAQNETERKKRIGILFDLNRMSSELSTTVKKLEKMQRGNGGWPWFEGMPDDPYITQLIVTGFGRLNRLGIDALKDNRVKNMAEKALAYCDQRIREEYEELKREAKKGRISLEDDHLGSFEIQYLYALSYFPNHSVAASAKEAFNYFKGQERKYWNNKGRYLQGMIAVSLHRYKDAETPAKIIRSLKETALNSEEMGMYWKENYEGYYWYQAPVEQQALMIEVFDEVANDEKRVDDLKTWLLKEKQTNDWKTTRATTDACYALLMRGTDWLAEDTSPEIRLGSIKVDPKTDPDLKTEAGTGYFKTSWSGEAIKPEMGKITVRKESKGVAWGAVYWQYFEQLDKITSHETPLKLKKQLFLQKDTDRGPVITPITEKTALKPGDRVKVRIELRVDRNMEYVHMKDMRASCMEPEHVLSGYRYQDGLGYYESTRDAAVNFFFGYLRKGTYVFEYPLRITHEGDFSNGVTTIQCMYAPEFTSHSEGIRIRVKK